MNRRLMRAVFAALFVAVFALPAQAQVFTGRIDVTAVDSTGAVLPGVTVEIKGVQNGSMVTDARGEAHFLSLPPGAYSVNAAITGFNAYKNSAVTVGAGTTVTLKATLTVGTMSTTENVVASTPLIDTKKETVSTNISLDELQKIPSSRDPWTVLQTVPGIIVDRVNVGGAESGQQSTYQAKGAGAGDNTWNMDGIAITDMAALGSSPSYYDFDMFAEMQVTTGGADVSTATPGVQLNMVLRSGTNQLRGSARYYFENNSMQSDNVATGDRGILASYNRMKKYEDFGGEAGGALIKNKLFAWGSYGKTHPQLEIFTRNPADLTKYIQTSADETILEDYAGKLSADLTKDTRASFTFFRGNKEKFGRGASASRPDETTENQTGPTTMYKGEISRTMGSVFATARYAHVAGGFSLTPRGGTGTSTYIDDAGVAHGSYYYSATNRPQDTASFDATMFKGKHELKFGYGWRRAAVTTQSYWPGSGVISIHSGYPTMNAQVVRPHNVDTSAVYQNATLADTISMDRLTVTAGVRYDRQAASLNGTTDPAQTNDPRGLLPSLTGSAQSNVIVFNSLTPRVGFTYAVDDARRTIVRGSYSMFASQMNATQASVLSTVQYSLTYYVNVPDLNGNKLADRNEIALGDLAAYSGFDINNPNATTTPNKIGNYKTPLTHEIVIGADHQIASDFAVGASYTWRKYVNFDRNHLIGVDGSKYTQSGTFTCTATESAVVGPCAIPFYKLNAAADAAATGNIFESWDGYTQKYQGLELTATKRMSHNWSARAAFSTNVHREYFANAAAYNDPTPTPASPGINGGIVITQSTSSGKKGIYLTLPRNQFIANAAIQAKWGITLGMNYLFRQGYAEPFSKTGVATGDPRTGNKEILLVGQTDWFRLPNVHSFDVRLGKHVAIGSHFIEIDLDAFNVLNLNTTLQRQYDLTKTTRNQTLEIMNPRILRIGARIGF